MIRALARQGIEDIDNADDLSEQRHLPVAKSIGITRAIEPLVVMPDDGAHLAERAEPGAQRIADDRMLAHHARLLRVERAAFEEHAVGYRDLTDVVQESAAAERGQVHLVEPNRRAERRRVT